jgi:hypothetical protein
MVSEEKIVKDLARYLSQNPITWTKPYRSQLSTRDLKELVNYLSSLYEQGELDQEDFSNLLVYVCLSIVEYEIEDRIQRVLIGKLPFFSHAGG